jgi:hypothetical protein
MMRLQRRLGVMLAASAALAVSAAGDGVARASTTCTWAGTPAAPTGTFTITPGLTNFPSSQPSKFVASGPLAGDDPRCRGQMRWVGQVDAGSSCGLASFEESVQGLPGVSRARGKGNIDVPQSLYDRQDRLVGVENAQVATQTSSQHYLDCNTPQGFAGGWPAMFSSNVVLFDEPVDPNSP